ncbi:chorismate mutase [unidentified bacterial endosymbiont]|uniref:chorismate mutase n=1 Tax=unidentified bacterial endosymbiont TaxID=2355 RepID=UPI0026468C13|nr:chorismate mutase [unidentified bacterial endosymbiont]
MQYVVIFLSSMFMCSTVFSMSVSTVSLGRLSEAINARMLLMQSVAAYKAAHHLAVEDLDREQIVLDAAEEVADGEGLAAGTSRALMCSLMNAGKAVQYRYLADWLATPDFSPSPESLAGVRAQISQLDLEILRAVSQRLMVGSFSPQDVQLVMSQLTAPNLSDMDKRNIVTALYLVRTHV